MKTSSNNVVVEEYNPSWPSWFQKIEGRLWPHVKEHSEAIEHVGSTSVIGLAAKPIIDIDIIVTDKTDSQKVTNLLIELGYEHRGDLGIEGRQAFRFVDADIKHNLYVCLRNSPSLRNHLVLRDHLRNHPNDAKEYGSLKRELALQYSDSIDQYIEGKTEFITRILSSSNFGEAELVAIANANKAPASNVKNITIRNAELHDLERLTEINNHYILNTNATFDVDPQSVEFRKIWFQKYKLKGPYQLLVAENGTQIIGCAYSSRYRDHFSFDQTVETSVYLAHDQRANGIGSLLYSSLFEKIESEKLHLAVAGIALPNDASIGLHKKFGFKEVGVFTEYAKKHENYISSVWMQKRLRNK